MLSLPPRKLLKDFNSSNDRFRSPQNRSHELEKGKWNFQNTKTSSLAAVHELAEGDGSELGNELLISGFERRMSKKTKSVRSVSAKTSILAQGRHDSTTYGPHDDTPLVQKEETPHDNKSQSQVTLNDSNKQSKGLTNCK